VRKPLFFVLTAAFALAIAYSFVTVHAADEPMPAVGQVAPTFKLPSQDGSQISLDSFKGKWVVLYFYPKDMTPGCTIEAHNFQRDLALFEAKNAVIVGVSVDNPDSHKQFCTKEGLTFRLLADPEHTVWLTWPFWAHDHRQPEHVPDRSTGQDFQGLDQG